VLFRSALFHVAWSEEIASAPATPTRPEKATEPIMDEDEII
jgi:hypothetical protein